MRRWKHAGIGARLMLTAALIAGLSGCDAPPSAVDHSASASAPPTHAIVNVTVIDAVGGARADQTVQFRDDRLTFVGPARQAPTGALTIIDGAGKFVIPGLWDMHVHLTYEPELTASMPTLLLAHGVTSVRDTGGLLADLAPVIERMRAPGSVAPRVYFSGPLLDGARAVYDGRLRREIGIPNADVDAALANLRTLHSAGVDFIKVYELVTPTVFAALVKEARRLELPIAAHVPLSMVASEAGAQVDSMEHLRNVELDCAAQSDALLAERRARLAANTGPGYTLRAELHAAQRLSAIAGFDAARCQTVLAALTNTVQVPTLRLNRLQTHSPFARSDFDEMLAAMPPIIRQQWAAAAASWRETSPEPDARFSDWSRQLVASMARAGVPIGAGTDTPIGYSIPGYSLHSELEHLVDSGLSPLAALAAATTVPARFFAGRVYAGLIEVGANADLLLLTADPLADIRHTRRIEMVVSKGRTYEPAALLRSIAATSD